MNFNSVTLVGRLTRDPELRTTTTGKNYATFSIAVNKRSKPQDGGPEADFFNCKVWGQTADYVNQYITKGRLILIQGRIETRKYTDKDGNNREAIDIVGDNVTAMDRQRDDEGGSGGGSGGGGGYSNAGASSGGGRESYSNRDAAPSGGGGGGRSSGGASRPAPRAADTSAADDEYDPFADS